MSYAIVYSSKTGNTKILADTLHDCLPQEASAATRSVWAG